MHEFLSWLWCIDCLRRRPQPALFCHFRWLGIGQPGLQLFVKQFSVQARACQIQASRDSFISSTVQSGLTPSTHDPFYGILPRVHTSLCLPGLRCGIVGNVSAVSLLCSTDSNSLMVVMPFTQSSCGLHQFDCKNVMALGASCCRRYCDLASNTVCNQLPCWAL